MWLAISVRQRRQVLTNALEIAITPWGMALDR
jgi:hypothetical protein